MAAQKRKISRRGIILLSSLFVLAVLFVLSLILFRPGTEHNQAQHEKRRQNHK